jgi:predicted AlkP superfamily pyrophosphatase or phosphodiesterase
VKDLGPFPFFGFWGPAAGISSSRWIAACAKWTAEKHAPTLQLVYLPHLDYDLQRFGPKGESIPQALRDIDTVVGELLDFYARRGSRVMIVSEYGISEVSRALHPNRTLRRAGYLSVRPSVSWEMLDAGGSRAFAVSDHQVSHIYVRDLKDRAAVAALFEKEKGHRGIYVGEERAKIGLNHERAGDIILLAEPDAWYTYYFWEDDSKAPDFARTVDIHRKPGYDPVELFLDPKLPMAKGRMAMRLLQKKLGFRYYMDVIGLDPSLVKGSHGTPAEKDAEGPVFIAQDPVLKPAGKVMPMGEVRAMIERGVTAS